MTSNAHSQVVQKQFGEQASAYLSSTVHAPVSYTHLTLPTICSV